MRPVGVQIKDIQREEYIEKFLMLFMPRKKEKVKVEMTVTVEIYTLSI